MVRLRGRTRSSWLMGCLGQRETRLPGLRSNAYRRTTRPICTRHWSSRCLKSASETRRILPNKSWKTLRDRGMEHWSRLRLLKGVNRRESLILVARCCSSSRGPRGMGRGPLDRHKAHRRLFIKYLSLAWTRCHRKSTWSLRPLKITISRKQAWKPRPKKSLRWKTRNISHRIINDI